MGMGVFTDRYDYRSPKFALYALLFCLLGRALNIVPLSFLCNLCRKRKSTKIPFKMQFVLWFTGLRGAIAFALAENMPGSNRDNYASSTLMICIITTVVFGGCTEKILTRFGMKQVNQSISKSFEEESEMMSMMVSDPVTRGELTKVYDGLKGICLRFDEKYLKRFFGGPGEDGQNNDSLGDYELKSELSHRSLSLVEDSDSEDF